MSTRTWNAIVSVIEVLSVIAVIVALVCAALIGGNRRQEYYNSINHPVYSEQAIEARQDR